ncbi:MAG: hypothetical protein CM1200mP18_10530 [Gammaproteobacteria bacterium]|nr:MAG: hypothetical protein CM1200mP18_10530 [Gammaproteobacteria bacterium]
MGLFHPFLDDNLRIMGVWKQQALALIQVNTLLRLQGGTPGILHGNRTYLLQDSEGQFIDAHSISAGLDYPGIGPEHSWLKMLVGSNMYR